MSESEGRIRNAPSTGETPVPRRGTQPPPRQKFAKTHRHSGCWWAGTLWITFQASPTFSRTQMAQ